MLHCNSITHLHDTTIAVDILHLNDNVMSFVTLQEAYCEYLRTINYISQALLEEAVSESKTLAVSLPVPTHATL